MIPLVVIGGYLGAGKTTLVNHLLRHAGGRRIAVLVNDFGSVSLDADLVVGAAGDVLALAGGCLCCSFGADLVGTLEKVVAREPVPDVVLVECSGVALPGTVARTATLARGVAVRGVVVLADAGGVQALAGDGYVGDTVLQQLQQADLLVVNQTDRASAVALADLRRWLDERAPGVPRAECAQARLPAEVVLGVEPQPAAPATTGGRYRRPAPASERFRFVELRVDGPVDPRAVAADLASPERQLLRAKGVVTGLDGRLWVLQVMGRRWDVSPAPGAQHAGLVVGIERA